ncbi:MAG: tRNA lysidine(34) synthetase TilS [Bryobacteraceae bacterium]
MRGDLLDRVVQTINRYSMLDRGDRVALAVSGGADSVFLFHTFRALVSPFQLALTVLHVNHQLRGEESHADEEFVRALASEFGIPFHSLPGRPGPGNLEQEARNTRRRLLEQARIRFGLNKVALGHTRTDQAETVLYRLLRGSGLSGLAAIAPTRGPMIRPLLALNRTEIRNALSEAGLTWREDSSNENQRFVRNRLRLSTLPRLARTYNPNLEDALAGTAELSRVEEEYWAGEIACLYGRIATTTALGPTIDVKTLAECHLAVRRRVIRHAIARAKGSLRSIDRRHVEAILQIVESKHGHDRVNIPGVDAIRSFDRLLLAPPERLRQERDYTLRLALGMRYELPFEAGAMELTIDRQPSPFCATVGDGSHCKGEQAFLDCDAIRLAASTGDLAVRNWQPGDKLQQIGQGSAVKIKTLFQEHRISLWRRKHWPVIVAAKEIVWVRGFGIDQRFAANPESSERVRLCFEARD